MFPITLWSLCSLCLVFISNGVTVKRGWTLPDDVFSNVLHHPKRPIPSKGSLFDPVAIEVDSVHKTTQEKSRPSSIRKRKANAKQDEAIVKLPSDWRKYRFLKLNNGLRIVLVSNDVASRSSASLTVGGGGWNDPKEFPGLAHLTEHMLFLSNKKYPELNSFNDFVSECSGNTNAFTADQMTTYFFDSIPECFGEALDRFGSMFRSPNFRKEDIDAEIHAVDNEYEKDVQEEAWKFQEIAKVHVKPGFPYKKFFGGNEHTLKQNGIDDLHGNMTKYFNQYYSPSNMDIALEAPLSLDKLETLAVKHFGTLKDHKDAKKRFHFSKGRIDVDLFKSKSRGSLVKYETFQEHLLTILWDIPPQSHLYAVSPLKFLKFMVGSSDPKSLNMKLRRMGLVNQNIDLDTLTESSEFDVVSIVITLTAKGLENVNNVIALLFEYLEVIQRKGVTKERYEFVSKVIQRDYEVLQQWDISSQDHAVELSSNMRKCRYEDLVTCSILLSRFDPHAINRVLKALSPERAIYFLGSPSWSSKDLKHKEIWFHTRYNAEQLPKSLVESFKRKREDFDVSEHNELIEESLKKAQPSPGLDQEERVEPGGIPVLVRESSAFRVWYKYLKEPSYIAEVGVAIRFSQTVLSVKEVASSIVFCQMASRWVSRKLWKMLQVGYGFELDCGESGVWLLKTEGFSTGIFKFVESILRLLLGKDENGVLRKTNEWMFDIVMESMHKKLSQSQFDQPSHRAMDMLNTIVSVGFWRSDIILNHLKDITLHSLKNFADRLLFAEPQAYSLECLAFGNVAYEAVENFIENILEKQQLPLAQINPSDDLMFKRTIEIPQSLVMYESHPNPRESNVAVANLYVQQLPIPANTLKYMTTEVMLLMLDSWMSGECYTQLRSVQQLGYIVNCGSTSRNYFGYSILVQSKLPVHLVNERIHQFVINQTERVEALTEDDFEEMKETVLSTLTRVPQHPRELSQLLWNEIVHREYYFTRKFRQVEVTPSLKVKEFQNFVKHMFNRNHMLSSRVYGCDEKEGKPCKQMEIDRNAKGFDFGIPFLEQDVRNIQIMSPLSPQRPRNDPRVFLP